MAELVTVQALRPVVVNHYVLYPGERRVIARALADMILRAQPGKLVIVIPLDPAPPPDVAPRDMEQPGPGPIHGDQPPPPEPDDRPRLSDMDRPRPPRKPKARD